MVSTADLNPISNFELGGIGMALLIFFLAILIVGLIGLGLFMWLNNKKLKYKVPLYKMIGGKAMKTGMYKARDFKIGFAGDKLWYVPKAKKYIPCGTIQSAPSEYIHFERSDGEWINIGFGDIDEEMQTAGARYIDQDMRATRIAISNLLEQRFKGKESFWDKYGNMIAQVIFYMIVCICIVVIFYQFSTIIDKMSLLFDKILAYEKLNHEVVGVVPAVAGLIMRRSKW